MNEKEVTDASIGTITMFEHKTKIECAILTKEDIQAIRKADSNVCFDLKRNTLRKMYEGAMSGNGQGQIRLHRKIKLTKEQEQLGISIQGHEHTIKCFAAVQSYAEGQSLSTETSCYEYHPLYSFDLDHVKTALYSLKEGDEVSLEWIQDNLNGYARDAGLHFDQLYLLAARGKTRMKYFISQSVCQNNSARMIRP